MAILTFNGASYTVDHAVKGADYIHGYDADSIMIVSFEGITDFSGFTYDGTYLEPEHCLAEGCNDVKCVDGTLKKKDGTPAIHASQHSSSGSDPITPADIGAMYANLGTCNGNLLAWLDEKNISGAFTVSTTATNIPVAHWSSGIFMRGAGVSAIMVDLSTRIVYMNSKNAGVWQGWSTLYSDKNITAETTDITAGSSALATGSIYQVYE